MNVLTFPSTSKPLKVSSKLKVSPQLNSLVGEMELNEDFFNFFSMNTQEQQLFFSQDGHLVPTRTNDELVGPNSLSTSQYTARFAYNGTTENHMANTAGEFKNISMNQLSTRAAIVAAIPMPDRIEQYGDENKLLYTNVNGTTFQNLTVGLSFPMQFATDGTTLSLNINGTPSNVPISAPTCVVHFDSFDGTNLFLTINGDPRKIVTAAP